jgi:hypothetical protein
MCAVIRRFIELRPVSVFVGTTQPFKLLYIQAITKFIKYADIEETVPNVKGKSPKYSAYAFTDNEWDALGLTLEVLNVREILSQILLCWADDML